LAARVRQQMLKRGKGKKITSLSGKGEGQKGGDGKTGSEQKGDDGSLTHESNLCHAREYTMGKSVGSKGGKRNHGRGAIILSRRYLMYGALAKVTTT